MPMTTLNACLADLQKEEPVSAAGIQALKEALDVPLPKELVAFLKISNGGELVLGENCIRFYSAEEIPGVDVDYHISDKTPGFVPIGTDEGDGVFVFDTRMKPPQILGMLFSAAHQPEEWTYYGATLAELLEHLKAGTHAAPPTTVPTSKPQTSKAAARKKKAADGPGEVRKFHPEDINKVGRGIGVCSLAVSPDGTRALTQHHYNPLSHWDLTTGQEIPFPGGERLWGDAVVFAPDGERVYVAAGSQEPYALLDLKTGKNVVESRVTDEPRIVGFTENSHGRFQSRVDRLELSPSGKYLYSASAVISLILDAATLKVLHQLPGGLNYAPCAAFAGDDSWMVLGYGDYKGWDQSGYYKGVKQGFVRIFSPATGECLRTFPSVTGVGHVSIASDGRIALAKGNEVWIIDPQSGEVLQAVPVPVVGAVTVCFTPDDTRLLIGTGTGKLLVLDGATYQMKMEMKGPAQCMQHMRVTRDSRFVVTGGARSGMIHLWRL